jgi:Outer membrane protein beta-barrel domain
MKIYILIVFGLIISLNLMAQEKPKKLQIGININFEKNLSSKNVAFDKYTGYIANYNKNNYKIGLNAAYQFREKITVNSGINYSNKDFTGTYYCAVCYFIIPPSPRQIDFRFIEVPLSIRYYFLPSKLKLFADVGLTNSFSLNSENVDNTYILGGKLGGGLDYNLKNDYSIQFTTEYNISLTKVYNESNFKIRTISFGLGLVKKM